MRIRWQHLLTDGLATAGLGLALVGLTGVVTSNAKPAGGTGNSGEITIHVESDCSGSDTDPKVGEQFWVGGKNFVVGTARWLFVTDGTNASDPVVIGPDAVGNGSSFCVGPYTLSEGHYKAYVDTTNTAPTNNAKTKVFKVKAGTSDTTAPPDSTPPPDTSEPTDTTEPLDTSLPPDTSGPDTSEPGTSEPGTSLPPDTSGPGTSGPGTSGPDTTDPAVTDPGTTTVDTGSESNISEPSTSSGSSGSLPSTGGSPSMSLMLVGMTMLLVGGTMRLMVARPS